MTTGLVRRTVPDEAWIACRGCHRLLYRKRFLRELHVCPECGWHGQLTAAQRIDMLIEADGREPLHTGEPEADPLGFVDTVPYPGRLDQARARTGLDEAVVCVRGRLAGRPVVLAVMDFRFMGGSLSSAVGERITNAAEVALDSDTPLVLVTASGGARMQEGALSLMQMVKTSQALGRLDEAGVPTVAVVTDPTYGGVAASFASLTDVIIAEPGARLGFAGPRVIQQTIRATLPDGFQSAEFLLQHGLIDAVTPRGQLRAVLARLLACATDARGRAPRAEAGPPRPPAGPVVTDPGQLAAEDAWQVVRRARDVARPTAADYAAGLVDGFVELHGDRASADCPAILAGVGSIEGRAVALLGHQKGHTTRELVAHNFGMPSPAGYRKAARIMRLAAKWGLPVVTLVDTPGAHPGPDAEANGQAGAIADTIRLMARLPVPVVSVITGEGGSGGALALAVANRVLMLGSAVYSVISPEGCAAILWQTPTAAPAAAAALCLTPPQLLRQGVVDGVIPEPAGGAAHEPGAAVESVRHAVAAALAAFDGADEDTLRRHRFDRFRAFGAPADGSGADAGRGRS